jgi:hypothetical protein
VDSENVSLELMWKVIEEYGIKRNMFERSNLTKNDISELYHLIKKNKRKKKEIETVRRLREYIEELKNKNKS